MNKYIYEYTFTRRRIAENDGALDTPTRSYALVRKLLEGLENERLLVVALNRKHRPLGLETLYTGHVAGASVRVSELFRFAVRINACGIVIAHNHPSGDPEPSGDDHRTTRDTASAGRILGIPLIDHIVVGETGFVSFRERGLL